MLSFSMSQKSTGRMLAVIWILSVLVAMISLRFLVADVELVMAAMLHHAQDRPLSFYGHVGLAPIALALLPLQFSHRLRARWRGLHRWLGRLYALIILIAGISGLVLGYNTDQGMVASLGLMLLALVWLATTGLAVWYAVTRQFGRHRHWMIRSAALTLAGVTLRLYLPAGAVMVGIEASYPAICWLCWVPNLMVAEWLITRERSGQPLAA